MSGTDLTILVALGAGVISFLSPCVLPLVPAYLGQLTAIAVASSADGRTPSRWTAMRHAIAYVAGFGAVFTLLGVTATFLAGPLVDYLAPLRTIGGVILIILGLNLAGILRIPALERTWRPLDAGAAGSLATATGSISLAGPGNGQSTADRLGGRVVSARGGWLASFGLGAIFAVGWTPCIGIILGGILTMAATSTTILQGTVLLVAYTLGLGLPFLAIALVYDRAPGADPAAHQARPGRLADRRPAGRVHRRRDDLRLAGPAAALVHLQHGHLTCPSDPSSPTSGNVMGSSVRSAAGSSWPRSWRSSLAVIVLVGITTPLGTTGVTPLTDPRATPFLIGTPTEGLQPGRPGAGAGHRAPGRRHLPADRPRRQADPARGPARQGGLAQLLGELVPAVPARDPDPANAVRAIPRPRASRSSASASRRRRRPTSPPTPPDTSCRTRSASMRPGTSSTSTRCTRCRPSSSSTPTASSSACVNGPVDEAGAAALIESMLPPAASPTPSG